MGLKLANVFSDNMVFQREAEVVIWGEAEKNSTVKGRLCGKTSECEVINGKFRLTFCGLQVGGPFQLEVSSENQSIILKNILVGDVWVAGGQSNMQLRLKDSANGQEYIKESNYPEIRYYEVPEIEYEDDKIRIPNLVDKGWQASSKDTSENFSAVAYHFAKNLYKNLKIPIGIIDCNKGATSASCWISEEYLVKNENVKIAYLDEYKKSIKNLTQEKEDEQIKELHESQKVYAEKEQEYKKKYPEKTLDELQHDIGYAPWEPPIGRKSYLRPCGVYKTMLCKITPYTVKGVIWYQGEQDSPKSKLYKSLFKSVIENWRSDFENENLPFVFVQLPMFNDGNIDTWQIIRDAQLYILKTIKNTSMVVTVDCGEKENVHPKDKKLVGERLALVVREDIYKENIKGHSPIYSGYEKQGDKIAISFDYAGAGELIVQGGGALEGFEIGSKQGKYYEANAEIVGAKVLVYSEKVKEPTSVRYGWKNYAEINLFNKYGLPASPFNTESKY